MFNLTHRRHFPVTKGCGDAVLFLDDGSWGFGGAELVPYKEPFNQENGCYSYSNSFGYNIGEDADDHNLLTMSSDEDFTISELEVWALNDE